MKFLLENVLKNFGERNFNYFVQDIDNIDIPTKDDLVQVLEKYLSEYSSIHIYVLIGFFLISVTCQILVAIFVIKKIQKFTDELKKIESKSSRFSELKIDALKMIYDKTVTFHYMNYKLYYHNTYSHETLKAKIANWKSEYVSIMDILHRERILLPTELDSTVKDFETQIRKIAGFLDAEFKGLLAIEHRFGTDNPQVLYHNQETEVKAMKSIIDNLLTLDEIKTSEILIQNFKKKIEEYFTSLGQYYN
jgi:hypothetical protein